MFKNVRLVSICLVAVFLGYTAWFLYRNGYNNGYEDCRAEMATKMKQMREANEKAISSAQVRLFSKIDSLQTENTRLSDEITKIDKASKIDPNANNCGIGINSVRRINSVK